MSGPRRSRLFPSSTRGRMALAGTLVFVLAAIVLAGYFYEKHRTGNIYHPRAPFVPQPTPTLPKVKGQDHFAWPLYGYTKNHTRFFPAAPTMRPPYRIVWAHAGSSLLEFPPVTWGNRIFQLADDATLNAIDKYTGQVLWSRRLGALSASTPAVSATTVYVTILSRTPGSQSGRVLALNSLNGHIRWARDLPSRAESSPLLDKGKLFFGSQNGTVYALNASNGQVLWTYHAAGAVKASPSLSAGVLYFGDYSGELQAVGEEHGHLLWRSGSGGALLGSGTFYSTPAVMYGRVFLGNTDGRVYAYDAASGALDWAVQTGAYVYASPAVTNAPGLGPTIYLGSYDGTFYALNARSGHIEWQYHAGGKISGSATIVGNIVYFADLGTHRTFGLGISTGKVVFSMNTGSFDPVISDNHYLYLSGITGLYALAPLDAAPQRARAPTTVSNAKAEAAAAAAAKAHGNATKRTKAKRVVVIHKKRTTPTHAPAKSAPAHARRRGT